MNKSPFGILPSAVAAALLAAVTAACTSVPGETQSSGGERRDASSRVLALANQGHPECKNAKIVDTQVQDVYGDGRVSVERWTVDRCGERVNFHVGFPAKGRAGGVQVRPE